MIKQKEITRTYRFSDADLKQITDSIITAARRDITAFNTRGVTVLDLDALQTECDSFADLPTDEELIGALAAATEARNLVREQLSLKLIEIRNMAEVKWDVKSVKYRTYDFKNLTDLSVNDFFRAAKRILRVATQQATDLASEGLTPLKLSELATDIADFDVKIDEQIDAERNRNIAAHDRVLAGNTLYTKTDRLASIGKNIWVSTNEAKYNDYVIENYLTNSGNTVLAVFEDFISPGGLVNLGALPVAGKIIRFTVLAGGPLEFGLSVDGSNFDGNTSTVGSVGSTTILISELASAGTLILVRNQSAGLQGQYKLEVLG